MIGFRFRALALLLGIPTIVTVASAQPSKAPAPSASAAPSTQPSASPSAQASAIASTQPSAVPSAQPSAVPSTQPAPVAPSKEDRKRANDLMDEGDEDVKKGDLAAALDLYQKAHAIMHVPSTGIEVARTLDKMGKLMEALAAAREVVAIPVTPNEPEPFTEARNDAKALVAALEARVPTLKIVVTGVGASTPLEVTLDGRKLSRDELAAPLVLPPGKYKVRATAEDHTPAFVDIELHERDRAQAALALARVLIVPPDPTPTAPPPPPPPAGVSPLVPAGFAIAGAGVLAGVITGAVAISAANEANNLCPAGACPDETTRERAQSRYNTADALAIAADVSFILALGGTALGVYGVASPPKPGVISPTQKTSVTVGPGRVGVRFRF